MRRFQSLEFEESEEDFGQMPENALEEYRRLRRQTPNSVSKLLEALDSENDTEIAESLNALNMELAVAQEEFLAAFPIEEVVHGLIECMQREYSADTVFLSITCLANMLDIAPSLASLIAGVGGIGILTDKLMSFEFIDMAEVAIKALERISFENASIVLKEGAFGTLVNMMDFFEINCQKQILFIAGNVIKSLADRESYKEDIVPCIPLLVGKLEFRGQEMLQQCEKVAELFSELIEVLAKVCETEELKEEMEYLESTKILKTITELVANAPSLAAKALALLKQLCKYSAGFCARFLSEGGVSMLKEALNFEEKDVGFAAEALGMLEVVLPTRPSESQIESEKHYIFKEHPEYLESLGEIIVPRVIQTYENIGSSSLKKLMINTLDKLIKNSRSSSLLKYIAIDSFSTFIAELLSSDEYHIVRTTLEILSILYDKVPQEVSYNFTREGVVARVQKLKKPENAKKLVAHEEPRDCKRLFTRPEGLDRHMFEELMSNLRRNLPRESSEEAIQEILSLTKKISNKHSRFENKRALQVSRELKKLAEKLSQSGTEETSSEIWTRLMSIFDGEKLSYYEVSQSGIAEAIWKWLTEHESAAVLTKRVLQFLTHSLKENKKHELYMLKLVTVLIGCSKFVSNFEVCVPDGPHPLFPSARDASRVKVSFLYSPQDAAFPPAVQSEYELRHHLFLSVKKFNVDFCPSDSIAELKLKLLEIKNKEDLKKLCFLPQYQELEGRFNNKKREKFQHLIELGLSSEEALDEMGIDYDEEPAEVPVRRKLVETTKLLETELSAHGKVLGNATILADLARGDRTTLSFRFKPSSEQKAPLVYIKAPKDILNDLIKTSLETGLEHSNKSSPYLRLLKLIFQLNKFLPNILLPSSILEETVKGSSHKDSIPLATFISLKFTALLSKQLQCCPLPTSSWTCTLPRSCSFLFPFTTKHEYFYSSTLRGHRPLDRMRGKAKVRVCRSTLLENAFCIFSDLRLLKQGPLDIEYEDEVGTGLGPTLEFYSLLSSEIRALAIWRSNQEQGVFPVPLQVSGYRVSEYFLMFGKLVAKALIDRKHLDIPFSPVWWKLVLKSTITLLDVRSIDPVLGKTLLEFQELVNRKKQVLKNLHGKAREEALSALKYRGSSLEALEIPFTLPGYEGVELKPNGASTSLSLRNLEEYIALVADFTVHQFTQAQAFRKGLDSLLPVDSLSIFSPEELENLICGDDNESWDLQTLQQNIVPDHGYSVSSLNFHNLLVLMSLFTRAERKLFLLFITGAPRLPLGGFSKLSPKLTVVKKEAGQSSDKSLPSVMTCQNYLKVPDYSNYEVLETQLKYAINEGHQEFHLS